MFLKSLYLQNFRCYKEAFFEFSSGINAIFGSNAKGKTTLLEAIHLLISGKSFRSSQFSDLVQIGTLSFYLEATFIKHQIEQTLRIHWDGKCRKIFYNSTLCPSITSLLGILQGGIITPDDVSLVKGSPEGRRHFLDLQMAQVDPLYVHHLVRYNRAMKQRNTLLRAEKLAAITGWEQEMASSATYIIQQRRKAVKDLSQLGREYYSLISGEEDSFHLTYKSSTEETDPDAIKQYLLHQYAKLRDRELLLGSTLTGPHKEDVMINIGKKEARFFASEGQQRSCVAAMRFAEWARLKRMSDEIPLMLIDDVGMSLDSNRRDRLIAHVETLGQLFLTSTDKLPVTKEAFFIEL